MARDHVTKICAADPVAKGSEKINASIQEDLDQKEPIKAKDLIQKNTKQKTKLPKPQENE